MQIIKLIQAKQVLTPLFQEKISARLSYKLMKFVSQLEVEENFYNNKMTEIINTYCERDSNGNLVPIDNGFKIRDDCISDCNNAISELEKIDVDTPGITFTVSEFDEIKLSINDMRVLSYFITEETL